MPAPPDSCKKTAATVPDPILLASSRPPAGPGSQNAVAPVPHATGWIAGGVSAAGVAVLVAREAGVSAVAQPARSTQASALNHGIRPRRCPTAVRGDPAPGRRLPHVDFDISLSYHSALGSATVAEA